MKKSISKFIEDKRPYIIDLTKRLVEIPTVNPPGENYEKLVGVLEKELKRIGLPTKRIETPARVLKRHGVAAGSRRINLIADWKTGSRKTLHINGHYDVVPVSGRWRRDPFKPVVKGDRLYGRGSEDMKGTIAAMILSVYALKSLKRLPRVNVQLSFTPDEEIGGKTGFGWLAKENKIKADFGLTEGCTTRFVSCGNKGILWARVTCLGKTAHGSMPHKGANSFDAMLDIATELKRLNKKLSKRKTAFDSMSERDRFSTMVLGGELEGGNKVNIVSAKTSFSIDRRLIPEETIESAKEEIMKAIEKGAQKSKGCKFKLEILTQDGPVFVDPKERICKAIGKAIKDVFKRDAGFLLLTGGTDVRYLIKKGIPSVGYSARGGESWHSENEFVRVSGIIKAAKVYALTILGL
ncbi:MAG: M20 family metallopeptidase [Candidatus Omnitrophota bacterium]